MRLILAALVLLVPLCGWCTPYFRFLGRDASGYHPTTSAQTFFDPSGKETSDFGASLAVFSHSTKDGAIFQRFQADWSPLTVGAGGNLKGAFMAVGPSANLSPATKALILKVVEALTKDGTYTGIKSLLSPAQEKPDITASYGAAFLVRPIEDGAVLSPGQWRGRFRLSAGIAWAF